MLEEQSGYVPKEATKTLHTQDIQRIAFQRDSIQSDSIMNTLFSIFPAKTSLNPRRRARYIVAMATCLLGIGTSLSASAACSFQGSSYASANIAMGSITVPANVAVGTVLATKTAPYDTLIAHQAANCDISRTQTSSIVMSGSGNAGIYPTNIPGIGVRVYVWSSTTYYNTPTTATLAPVSWSYTLPSAGAYGTGYLQMRIDLVATGPINVSSGNALSYSAASWFTMTDGINQLSLSGIAVNGTVTVRSCSVTTSSVDVTLPKVFAKDLSTTGATSGATPMKIGLSCSQGTNVKVTLTDASDVSNRSTTLGLAPGSSATGVGMQILNGSTPVAYGPDSSSAANVNQWSAGTAAGGAMNVPLTVQYIRTPGTLVPGIVKGTATFTMSYQ
ncbi:fimbrial protein [Paraburkholderia fungorum]|uniref:fimbrial protein n=1 Tax=Paraburkholderia fungorum TaxID=134537 RepID=UPI0016076511|nr:fimbrial protein [Paraburkholderia fungorum]MBB4512910.1 type 1 fimbria pilin [Paraburkholderia fungorum]